MKKRQRGVSLSGLIMACIFIAIVAVLGMKVAPEVIDYLKVVQAIKAVSQDAGVKGSTVGEIRKTYTRFAIIDSIDSVKAEDIDITKEGNDIVLSFAYTKRIPLFGNVSLLIDFEGSTAK